MKRPSFLPWLRLGFALTACHAALAAAPFLEKSSLFEAGVGGYAYYRVPGLVVTAKGTVLAYCEARRTGRSDWENIDLLLRRSTDGGKTWDAPRQMASVPGPHRRNPVALARGKAAADEVTYSNPVAIAGRDGSVHFLFCLEFNRCFHLRSDDDGATFSAPVEFTAALEGFRPAFDWKVVALGPMHGVALRNGRLVVAVWLALGTQGSGFHPSAVATIYSDDRGQGWRCGDIAVPGTAEWVNPNSPAIAELDDGRVMINTRNESKANRRLVTVSPDGATHWSAPRFDDALLEPICEGSLARLSARPADSRSRLLFANPRNLARADGKEAPGRSRDRRNLSVHLSYDEGRTWTEIKSLEPGDAQFSDLGVLPDGTILCLYEAGQSAGEKSFAGHNVRFLTLARFNLEWLTDGRDALPGSAEATAPPPAPRFPPLPLAATITVSGLAIELRTPPAGLVVRPALGLLTAPALDGAIVHRTATRVLETRAVKTPGGDYLLMFPEGEHYATAKGRPKVNSMIAYRSSDRGRTWAGPNVAFDIDYSQHGFVPLIPRGSRRIYAFGTQPVVGYHWENGQRENAPIGFRWSDDDGRTWSDPRFVFANALRPDLKSTSFNHQCSYLDAFSDGGVLHLFFPHRWQQVVHLTLEESALATLPTRAQLTPNFPTK